MNSPLLLRLWGSPARINLTCAVCHSTEAASELGWSYAVLPGNSLTGYVAVRGADTDYCPMCTAMMLAAGAAVCTNPPPAGEQP